MASTFSPSSAVQGGSTGGEAGSRSGRTRPTPPRFLTMRRFGWLTVISRIPRAPHSSCEYPLHALVLNPHVQVPGPPRTTRPIVSGSTPREAVQPHRQQVNRLLNAEPTFSGQDGSPAHLLLVSMKVSVFSKRDSQEQASWMTR